MLVGKVSCEEDILRSLSYGIKVFICCVRVGETDG